MRMKTGDSPRERDRSTTRLVQQGHERQSVSTSVNLFSRHPRFFSLFFQLLSLPRPRPREGHFEAELASVTLWPELEKVFGHGYEVSEIT
jgi:hypothetical protein